MRPDAANAPEKSAALRNLEQTFEAKIWKADKSEKIVEGLYHFKITMFNFHRMKFVRFIFN